MLIIPLHRAPTLANLPWITLALIVVNVFVFSFLQSRDGKAQARALDYYVQQDLAQWEFPAYRRWLSVHPEEEQRSAAFAHFSRADPRHAARILQSDDGFLAQLHGIGPSAQTAREGSDDVEQWRAHREEFERLWERAFTERWVIHFSQFSPARMFGAMFLHGSVGHLLGNMLFLALLGLLVEGALGHGLFLALYLLGGMGSALLSVAWRWGETGSALGASGAIAALMGAYCVLWGMRKVRFFWWFFVVFNYIKAPALVLLPFWLGWELFNLFWNTQAHVGFDAHAGGIVCGALLALVVRWLHWEDRAYLDEDTAIEARADRGAALARAHEHLGHLQVPAARALLEPLFEADPGDAQVCAALYRCARLEPRMPRLAQAARAVFALPARTSAQAREQKAILDDALKAGLSMGHLDAPAVLTMLRRWALLGLGDDSAQQLVKWIETAPSTPGLQAACLGLARDLQARSQLAGARALLECSLRAWPQGGDADKARLLLGDLA